jgi:hypothetical protein
MKHFVRQLIRKHKALILNEATELNGFMKLLMKQINTNEKWTGEEKKELKNHLKRLSLYIPVLLVFLLPFGMLLIPVLAENLDRRAARRFQGRQII